MGANFGLDRETAGNLVISVVVILVVLGLRLILLRLVERRIDSPTLRYKWSKGSAYVAFVFIALLIASTWAGALRSAGTFLGLLTAGLAIALKDLVASLAGWLFILWRRPFELGDRIQVGEHAGDVIDLRIFQFTILEIGNWVHADQSTGRIIHLPNLAVFNQPLANYTSRFEYLWNEVEVLVTFESDWRKAKAILDEIGTSASEDVVEEAERALRKASRKFLIFYQKLSPVVYTSVKESGVLLTLRFLCKPRARRGANQMIWEAILSRFAQEADIDFAYPTQRLYFNLLEGKEDARAPIPAPVRGLFGGPVEVEGVEAAPGGDRREPAAAGIRPDRDAAQADRPAPEEGEPRTEAAEAEEESPAAEPPAMVNPDEGVATLDQEELRRRLEQHEEEERQRREREREAEKEKEKEREKAREGADGDEAAPDPESRRRGEQEGEAAGESNGKGSE